jgi:hypothetical protein
VGGAILEGAQAAVRPWPRIPPHPDEETVVTTPPDDLRARLAAGVRGSDIGGRGGLRLAGEGAGQLAGHLCGHQRAVDLAEGVATERGLHRGDDGQQHLHRRQVTLRAEAKSSAEHLTWRMSP